ncbi:MAG: photosynthetic complex putative assembly protein PuhB [Devosiaceae bacterium]
MNYIHNHDDYATEPVRGLPAALPRGEFVLWQGAPDWRAFASQVFKTRIIIALVVLGAATRFGLGLSAGTSIGVALGEASIIAAFGLAGVALLSLLAWLVHKSTVYTITNKRIVMRIGVAIQKTFNVPFATLDGGALKEFSDGTGNLSAVLKPGISLAHLIMWPHVRPWKMAHTQPTLRAIPDAASVARLLTDAFTSHAAASDALERNGANLTQGLLDQDASKIPAASSNAGDTASDAKDKDPHYIPKPLMIMAASLALLTVLAVAVAQFGGFNTSQRIANAPISFSQDIAFIPQENDRIAVTNATTGDTITVIETGTDGLLRSAIRGLGGSREAANAEADAPYQLQMLQDDGVYLSDVLTGRAVRLESFGPLETGATADLLRLVHAASGTAAQ